MEKVQDPVRAESLKSTTTVGDERVGLLHLDTAEERIIVRKLDFTIVPIMALFYLLSFLVSRRCLQSSQLSKPSTRRKDRANIGVSTWH